MSEESEACGNCKFYLFSANLCRRFPPQNLASPDRKRFNSQFPIMQPKGWCGEWQKGDQAFQ